MRSVTKTWAPAISVCLLASVSTLLVQAAPAQSAPCPDVELIFARGTSEAPGIGRVGQALNAQLAGQLGGRSVGVYGVNYPATYDFLAAADGAIDATNRIASMSQQCPGTRFILGGYSQGAAVVDMLMGIPPLGNKVGDVGSAPPLPAALADKVAAVAVFGNPSAKFGIPVSAALPPFAGKGIDMCNNGDPICSQGRNPFAHTSYENTDLVGQAAGFISQLM
ncbi:MAG TPA: cutinase family protein [Mycobacterium sp.]|uniref:cutinase family protein n=1 Tax=Mycolicibacterium sp. TaxID=2320850 RepID=UPI0025D6A37D|nr:cutinase family protein [Mycolicibacterium sp.]HQC78829.1 cutinase family protein [Mycobacterium sp.]